MILKMTLKKIIWKRIGFLFFMIAITFVFTTCDNGGTDELTIKEAEDIPSVEVPYGTSGDEVISNYLPKTSAVELSSGETVTVNISWIVPDDYSGAPGNAP